MFVGRPRTTPLTAARAAVQSIGWPPAEASDPTNAHSSRAFPPSSPGSPTPLKTGRAASATRPPHDPTVA